MARGRPAKKGTKSQTTGEISVKKDVPDVYREMLADAVLSSPSRMGDEGKTVKRRRVGGRLVTRQAEEAGSYQSNHSIKAASGSDLDDLFEDVKPIQQQIIQTDSEDSADGDMDWEEVHLGNHVSQEGTPEPDKAEDEGLNLVLKGHGDKHKGATFGRPKRKPMTAEDRKLRLDIHKLHLCCLMVHIYIRNHWCNDEKVYTAIRKLLTKKMVSYLNPDEDKSQFQRSRSFMDGLAQTSEAFRGSFKVKARGMGRSRWADGPETLALLQPPDDIDLPLQIADFRDAAHQLDGSRDVGAQLYCAMLRSAGIDARLVCSLQPLPFQPSQKVELHQVKQRANRIAERKGQLETQMNDPEDGTTSHLATNARRRSASPAVELMSSRIQRKPLRESKYPVYWVEAFNEAVQKWVPVDPLVTKSVAKPSKFEPPAGEPDNSMSYVLAFEEDGSARDVTKRYVKAYNAKTRRERVEMTNGGERWWRRVMKMYRRRHHMDRDQLEDAELATKEAAEPMPKNVQDFKGHPYYALERHLKRHEVIHPKREVGKIGAGRASSTNFLEPIYRRRDVHIVKSADKWYRSGREIKPGEQPLKRVAARGTRQQSLDPNELDQADDNDAETALYAAHQTTLYSAPPVVNGLIPKNVYGNLDVYVSSMVPPGGAHIAHPEAAKAAKIIGVDYADAVTGFSFKGRHGTAITNGAIVAIEYKEAVEAVILAFEDDRLRAEEERRSLEALRTWKRLLVGLRIRQRIESYDIEGEKDAIMKEELEKAQDEDSMEDDEAGGFLPDRQGGSDPQPTAGGNFEPCSLAGLVEDEGGGFMAEESEERPPVPRVATPPPRLRDAFLNNVEDDYGGGFLISDDDTDAQQTLQDTATCEHQGIESTKDTRNRRPNLLPGLEDHDQNEKQESRDQGLAADDTVHTIETANQIPAHTSHETANKPSNKTPNPHTNPHTPDFITSSGLQPQDLEESRLLEQLYATTTTTQPPPPSSPSPPQAPIPPQTTKADPPSPLQTKSIENNEDEDHHDDQPPDPQPESPESDKGSLLSQDPEDEDAEPDWLD